MIISKLPNVGTTIFTQMSQLAVETGALNLSQGFPDFDGPQALRDALGWHAANGHNQYAPMTGLPALRQQVAAKIARSYGVQVDADAEVTITPGAQGGQLVQLGAADQGTTGVVRRIEDDHPRARTQGFTEFLPIEGKALPGQRHMHTTVSYTHLTLPTKA